MLKIKSGIKLFFTKTRIKVKAITNRFPRRLRKFEKPLIGGLIGLIGGIPGFFIGLLLGYLLGELFGQTSRDKKIIEYLENPGSQQLNESEPGLAAWCALGILVAAENGTDSPIDSPMDSSIDSSTDSSERILKQIFLEACYVFNSPLLDLSQIEHFSRLAWQKRASLNPDLLAESFTFRRSSVGDAGNLARRFSRLAVNQKAKTLAGEIAFTIDPAYINEEQMSHSKPKDPWKILGLPPGTPTREIKAHYRRLAKQFHPDNLEVLDEVQKETAARAFMAIKEAYQKITEE